MQKRERVAWRCLLAGFLGFLPFSAGGLESSELSIAQKRLGLPENLARVTDVRWDSSQTVPTYILVQDMHTHPQVQSRIASLIVHGYQAWGVKKVFVEGAFTPLDLTVFHRIPDSTKSLLMERLVKDGELSGPEFAAVVLMDREWRDPPVSPFQTFGMEDPTLYRDNMLAYRSVLAHRERALEAILAIRRLHAAIQLLDTSPMSTQLSRVEALIRLKLTPSEYEAYLKTKAQTPTSPDLTPALKAAEEFYRLVQLRSRVFLMQASRTVPASAGPRVLVVGGFHTAAMADILRRSKASYVVLSPVAGSDENEEPIYEERLQKTANVLAQAIPPDSH